MELKKTVSRSDFYTDYVNILNGVLQLSPREAEVFSYLLFYNDNGYKDNINHKDIRNNIVRIVGISKANLSRYLNTIKTKGLIIRGKASRWVINDNIKPSIFNSQINISFVLNVIEDAKKENTITGSYSTVDTESND